MQTFIWSPRISFPMVEKDFEEFVKDLCSEITWKDLLSKWGENLGTLIPYTGQYFAANKSSFDHEVQLRAIKKLVDAQDELSNLLQNLFELKDGISRESYIKFTQLPTRKEYNDAIIDAIESAPKSLLAIIVGPHFLDPMWIIQRRLEREYRKSFRLTLKNYLKESLERDDRDIRLIIRNSRRYTEVVKKDIRKCEIDKFVREMKSAMRSLLFPRKLGSTISFCCWDPGLFQVIITDEFCFEPNRDTDLSPIDSGNRFEDPTYIRMRRTQFELKFDKNFKGLQTELKSLERYIDSLRHVL